MKVSGAIPTIRRGIRRLDRSMAPLDQAFNPRRNSFSFLRLVFAAMVLLSHSFPLGGFNGGLDPMWSWTRGQEDFGGLAVAGFFVVSGFLVTRSFATSSTAPRYLWKRFLRIFPGFWACLLITAAVFGTIAFKYEHGSLHGYLHGYPDSPIAYVRSNVLLTMNQYSINTLLSKNPYPHAFDGSLWTLIYEFKCYLAVFVLGAFGILKRARVTILGLGIFLWTFEIIQFRNPTWVSPSVPFFGDYQLIHLSFLFCLGALLFLYRDRVPISNKLAFLAVGAYVLGVVLHLYPEISEPAFAYLCLWAAIRLPLHHVDRYGDFSYGLYVYAFPVQQLAAMYGAYKLGLPAYLAITFSVSMVFAFASWHLVENPFLRLKRVWFPSRWSVASWRRRPTHLASDAAGGVSPAVASGPAKHSPDTSGADDGIEDTAAGSPLPAGGAGESSRPPSGEAAPPGEALAPGPLQPTAAGFSSEDANRKTLLPP